MKTRKKKKTRNKPWGSIRRGEVNGLWVPQRKHKGGFGGAERENEFRRYLGFTRGEGRAPNACVVGREEKGVQNCRQTGP